MTNTETNTNELIDLNEAVAMSGRSKSTLRNWVKAGKLKDHRSPGATDKTPMVLSKQELHQACIKKSTGPKKSDKPKGDPADMGIMDRLLDQMEARITDKESERSRLETKNTELEAEVRKLKAKVDELKAVNEALRREMNGGIGGYLAGRVARRAESVVDRFRRRN